jgi:hypothetical protein
VGGRRRGGPRGPNAELGRGGLGWAVFFFFLFLFKSIFKPFKFKTFHLFKLKF